MGTPEPIRWLWRNRRIRVLRFITRWGSVKFGLTPDSLRKVKLIVNYQLKKTFPAKNQSKVDLADKMCCAGDFFILRLVCKLIYYRFL